MPQKTSKVPTRLPRLASGNKLQPIQTRLAPLPGHNQSLASAPVYGTYDIKSSPTSPIQERRVSNDYSSINASIMAPHSEKNIYSEESFMSPPSIRKHPSSADGPVIDRVRSPGKLRAFFEDAKRSASSGEKISIVQKYKDMVQEQKAAAPVEFPTAKKALHVVGKSKPKIMNNPSKKPELSPLSPGLSRRSTYDQEASDLSTPSETEIEASSQWYLNEQKVDVISELEKEDWSSLVKSTTARKPNTPKPVIPPIATAKVPAVETASKPSPKPKAKTTSTKKPAAVMAPREEVVEEPKKKRSPTPDGCVRCEHCERTFASDRLEKHQKVCQDNESKGKKKRPVLDGAHFRMVPNDDNTLSPSKTSTKKQPAASKAAPKKKDWRKQHEEFIVAIRAAKADPVK
ncbi:hypothetical protein MP638_004099 [Amoeboaphelidium occidentale]|nr:hypothetical protein MP638_004099 [Amoeboaphelidium occidentale]